MKTAAGVVAKDPRKFPVKTRLAAAVGKELATCVYRDLLNMALEAIGQSAVEHRIVSLLGNPANLIPKGFEILEQAQGTMGEVIEQYFCSLPKEVEAAVLIGSDCPFIDSSVIKEALQSLHQHDLCFVPAIDGGYALIGMRRFVPEVVRNMPYSTSNLLQKTLEVAENANLSCCQLPAVYDIDDWETLQKWLKTQSSQQLQKRPYHQGLLEAGFLKSSEV